MAKQHRHSLLLTMGFICMQLHGCCKSLQPHFVLTNISKDKHPFAPNNLQFQTVPPLFFCPTCCLYFRIEFDRPTCPSNRTKIPKIRLRCCLFGCGGTFWHNFWERIGEMGELGRKGKKTGTLMPDRQRNIVGGTLLIDYKRNIICWLTKYGYWMITKGDYWLIIFNPSPPEFFFSRFIEI